MALLRQNQIWCSASVRLMRLLLWNECHQNTNQIFFLVWFYLSPHLYLNKHCLNVITEVCNSCGVGLFAHVPCCKLMARPGASPSLLHPDWEEASVENSSWPKSSGGEIHRPICVTSGGTRCCNTSPSLCHIRKTTGTLWSSHVHRSKMWFLWIKLWLNAKSHKDSCDQFWLKYLDRRKAK